MHCSTFLFNIFDWQKGKGVRVEHIHLVVHINPVVWNVHLVLILWSFILSLCPMPTWPTELLTLLWANGEPQKSRLHRGRQNGGDVGLAQPSVDYDVDSNPEGWTERLGVEGLGGRWALARWIHYSRHGLCSILVNLCRKTAPRRLFDPNLMCCCFVILHWCHVFHQFSFPNLKNYSY